VFEAVPLKVLISMVVAMGAARAASGVLELMVVVASVPWIVRRGSEQSLELTAIQTLFGL
jgi:hypothetical protein